MSVSLSQMCLIIDETLWAWAAQVEDCRKSFFYKELLSRLPDRQRPAATRPGVSRHRGLCFIASHIAGCLDDKLFNFSGLMIFSTVFGIWHSLCSAMGELSTRVMPKVGLAVASSKP